MDTLYLEPRTRRAALTSFLREFTTEVTSKDKASLNAAGELLPPGTQVFVAFLPQDSAATQAAAAAHLRAVGLVPVPHIVARNMANVQDLDETLARFAGEAGVDRALVLGGDRDRPRGDFRSSLQLLETGLFEKHGITEISIACYPEGHPRISASDLGTARDAKLLAAQQRGLAVTLINQFCFSAKPIIDMARQMRAQGVIAPIRVGVAGPADHATLIKYALICGVGRSLRALRERQDLANTLLAGETPENLLAEIAAAQEAEPSLGLVGAHFFTFATLSNLTKWLRTLD